MRDEAKKAGIYLNVIKIDITDPIDIDYASKIDLDIVVNNAGIGEGGSIIDMPPSVFRRQFEVNVFGSLEFSKPFIKQFTDKGKGRIAFVSSIAGFLSGKYTGAYTASKHALESIVETLKLELEDFGVSVSTINPAPYKTGFNDVQIEACYNWYNQDNAIIPHENLSFPMPQYDQYQDIDAMVDVILDYNAKVRNVFPVDFSETIKEIQKKAWTEKNNIQ